MRAYFCVPAVPPAEESEGVVGVGVAGVAVEPESAGAGVVAGAGVLVAGAGSDAAGATAAGVAGASSRLLQPARTAVKTAAAKRVWRICMFCLQRLLMGLAEIKEAMHMLLSYVLAGIRQLLEIDYCRSGRLRLSENGAS